MFDWKLVIKDRISIILFSAFLLIFLLVYHDLIFLRKIFMHDSIFWYGSFHYYAGSLLSGHFPYWNPYMHTGTYFYPEISLLGLLDPAVLSFVGLIKLLNLNYLTAYVYFFLFRLFIFILGAFFLFRHITGCQKSALMSAGVLFLASAPTFFWQSGPVNVAFLTPFSILFILLFFELNNGPKKYLYLFCFVLTAGITMNVFIPAYYLFNLVAFLVVAMLLGIIRFRDVVNTFRGYKNAILISVAFLMILLMMMPPLLIWLKDSSKDGELFPYQRILQKNDLKFKKIMASEVASGALSGSFTEQKGVFSSYGNILNIIYPDINNLTGKFASNGSLEYFTDKTSEVSQYIGIIPFLICIIGLMYHKSRFRYLSIIMMFLISINMFSHYRIVGAPFYKFQIAFNAIFPPLGMIEVRETFGSFLMLYMCILLSLGFSIFFKLDVFMSIIKKKYKAIISICLAVIALKVAISGYFGNDIVFTTFYDLFVIIQLALFAVLVFGCARSFFIRRVFFIIVLFIIFADMFWYNKISEEYILQDKAPFQTMITTEDKEKKDFQYFRVLMGNRPKIVAYYDTIIKEKGMLSYGYLDSAFTTKKYYEYITHVPMKRQFVLSGVVFPIVSFFPMDKVVETDKHELLGKYMTNGDDLDDLWRYLYIQKDVQRNLQVEMKEFDAYEDVLGLQPNYAAELFNKKSQEPESGFRDLMTIARTEFIQQSQYIEVTDLSPNEVNIKINNAVDGYLYYNDGWSRYWKAFEGGKELPVRIADYNFKAVFINCGEHNVRFVFDPVHYKVGLMLFYMSMSATVVLIGLFYIKSRKS